MSDTRFSRRYFFYGSLLAGAIPAGGFGSAPSLAAAGFKTVLDKLNVAGIGFGNRGADDLATVATSENIVALCDVNEVYAARVFNLYNKATRYKDFRVMLEKEKSNIDAVIIGTPDHSHALIGVTAMQHGKHVYCEKPLTRTAWEARLMRDAAHKYNVATQMGNQGYSHEGTRTAAEIVWSGDIGTVKEVHAWTGGLYPGGPSHGGDDVQSEPPAEPLPDGLDWDLWLACAATQPFTHNKCFLWRAYLDFATGGSLGDWLVHCLGPANLALKLSEAPPTSVECVEVKGTSKWTWPTNSHIKYEFPARGAMPPVTVNIYQNLRGDVAYPAGMADDERLLPRSNNLFDGEEPDRAARTYTGTRNHGRRRSFPGRGTRGRAGGSWSRRGRSAGRQSRRSGGSRGAGRRARARNAGPRRPGGPHQGAGQRRALYGRQGLHGDMRSRRGRLAASGIALGRV